MRSLPSTSVLAEMKTGKGERGRERENEKWFIRLLGMVQNIILCFTFTSLITIREKQNEPRKLDLSLCLLLSLQSAKRGPLMVPAHKFFYLIADICEFLKYVIHWIIIKMMVIIILKIISPKHWGYMQNERLNMKNLTQN